MLSSCSEVLEDIGSARKLLDKGDNQAAIELLSKYKSGTSKRLLAEAHLAYGIEILKYIDSSKQERYIAAKQQFEEALKLNPKNEKAKDFYQMIIRLQNTEGQ